MLPAVHALTGCDTTYKIATKYEALNTVQKPGSSLVPDFNSSQLTESSIQTAGKMSQTSYRPGTFDDLHLATFNCNALKLEFKRTACTSPNARNHIHRVYYQVQLLVQAPFVTGFGKTCIVHTSDFAHSKIYKTY